MTDSSKNEGVFTPEHVLKRTFWQLVDRANLDKKELNGNRLRTLKNLLKTDQNFLEPLLSEIFKALHRDNSETRFGAVLIVHELFPRSHKFRELLVDDFQDFLLLCAETDPLRWPLPEPKDVAKSLKLFTMKSVQKWHEKFGRAYRKLDLAFGYLKQCKALDFQRLEAETLAERQRAEIEETRKQRIRERICLKIESEMQDWQKDCERCITEMNNAFELVYPVFIETGFPEKPAASNSRAHGLQNFHSGSVELCLDLRKPTVHLSEDNQALVQALQDNEKLLRNSFLPKVTKCLQSVTKVGGCDNLLKKLIDMKNSLEIADKKFHELNLPEPSSLSKNSDQTDSDFEEVPEKEGLELEIKNPDFVPQYILDHTAKIDKNREAFSPSEAESKPGTSGGWDVPVLDYGLDLKYWEHEKIEPPLIARNNSDSHRFWRPPVDDEPGVVYQETATEAVRSRVIEFTGKFQPVERLCGAPLKNGTLCQRKDRFKCPFHGQIMDRDESGALLGGPATTTTVENNSAMPWRDLDLLEDVEAASGQNLGAETQRNQREKGKNAKGRGKREKRQSTAGKSTRKRLGTKLLDKKSLKRIGNTLDAMQKARNDRKFRDQFNYSLSR